MQSPHRVVIAAFPGVELLNVTGPAEVFSVATRVAGTGRSGYTVRIATAGGEPVATAGGIRLMADLTLDEVHGDVDTLLVSGAVRVDGHEVEPVLDGGTIDWLRRAAPGTHRVASVCSGAHLLAAAGLLDGLSATTHWRTAARLASDHPQVTVDPDPIFIREGRLWTCAGIAAGMDMALAMVTEDHGPGLALATARTMVMYVKRAGGQSQFSVPLTLPADPGDPAGQGDRIDELRRWIGDHLTEDLSAEALAARLHLSVRHFSRLFSRRTATTPAAYVESVRLEAARQLLQDSGHGLPEVAALSGLGSVESLHRSFRRRLGTTPAEYRRRFR
ncbi:MULTISPECIES: GlxA family transcriptional regulator [Streptomyces]|uniref:GlxA family transcriptional regulator n=1 Tax=Streptomyces TaxID=1883 RepID=UPI0004BDA2BB|nr:MULTISPECIES: helix-turn-helix domain-containing protein [Streptomyces]KOU14442.1 transcriptional regulator [Streptomyces sp. WM6349]KOU82463.1 transcriptional regulator [Streptomyces sp. XY593]KOV40246.1 transcriptional regulator [Streptomyces sp. H036]MCI4079401.1 helix-turn-helix domain-containing protein [Streptomyces sp. MMS21 TC-5]QNE29394.1 helix-turn-helix domain-containing protein [Streptomyces sp. INR7]